MAHCPLVVLATFAAFVSGACDKPTAACNVSVDCHGNTICVDGVCTADSARDAGVVEDAGTDAGSDVDAGNAPFVPPWGINEPNDASGNESCLELRLITAGANGPGTWNDANCTGALPYVCNETPAGVDAGVPAGCTVGVDARLFCGTALAWSDAEVSCEAAQTTLAIVLDNGDSDSIFAASNAAFAGAAALWLGANDAATPDVWHWVDGTPLVSTFSIWASAPSGGAASKCLRMVLVDTGTGAAGRWDADDCARTLPFACDVPAGTLAPNQCTVVVEGAKSRVLCATPTSASAAAAVCAGAHGGALAEIDAATENATLLSDAEAAFGAAATDVWLGGSDEAADGVWTWPSGAVFDRF